MNRPKHGEPWSAKSLTLARPALRCQRGCAQQPDSGREPREGTNTAPSAAHRHRNIIISLAVDDPFTATG